MAKKKSWFNLLKKFFVSESESRLEKGKRKRWVFTRLKIRRLVASSALSSPRERRHQKAEEKQSKHDINVGVERIAETNADAKTPEVEAEMASLKEGPESIHDPKNETIVPSRLTLRDQETQYFYLYESQIENFAAIKLQTAFRGYLARKALRALKGLVRLQAIVRGRAVRRQAIATLKSLQSIVNIQSEVCAKRCDQVKSTVHCQQNTLLDLGEKNIKIDLNSQKRWDNRYLSREEENKMFSSKREAAIKRERIREYWLSHRRSTESEVNGRRQYWLEQWVDAQLAKRDDLKNVDTLFSARNKEEFERKEIKSRPFPKQYHTDQELVSPIYVPRRSFHHRRQKSSGDEITFMGSPSIPTYMAATESARAKARSLSSPRLRPINTDVYSEINSPYKYKLSPISSINSDATVTSRIGSVTGLSQRSPCLNGTPVGPIKSTRSIKDLTFGSDGAFANWDRIGACRIISMLSE